MPLLGFMITLDVLPLVFPELPELALPVFAFVVFELLLFELFVFELFVFEFPLTFPEFAPGVGLAEPVELPLVFPPEVLGPVVVVLPVITVEPTVVPSVDPPAGPAPGTAAAALPMGATLTAGPAPGAASAAKAAMLLNVAKAAITTAIFFVIFIMIVGILRFFHQPCYGVFTHHGYGQASCLALL